jgi:diguanylate cyclase (GGDEF)-like protein
VRDTKRHRVDVEREKKRSLATTSPLRESRFEAALKRIQETRPLLLILDGPRAGERVPLVPTPMVVGRTIDAHIQLPDENVSSRHARIEPEGEERFRVRDLGSLNGTFVNGQRVEQQVLQPGDRLLIGQTPLRFVAQTVAEEDLLQYLETCAVQDPLTLLHNRRYFDLRLAKEVSFADRHHAPLSLLMLDIDHFKRVNDEHGHLTGDRLLVELAAYLRAAVRGSDVLARIGGEEFGAILRQTTAEGARNLGERLRAGVENMPFVTATGRLPVTISIGVATMAGDEGPTAGGLLEMADRQLYRAKKEGRNRVCAEAG